MAGLAVLVGPWVVRAVEREAGLLALITLFASCDPVDLLGAASVDLLEPTASNA